jgi:dTMP kinase
VARGLLITLEGGEGTGKSTQLDRLERHLGRRGREVVRTREPGGTPLAEALRALLLEPSLRPDGVVELLLVEAARRDHVERVVRPALERGAVVLCDRFTDSTLVYQGVVRGLGEELAAELNRLATGGVEPDLTLLLDLDERRARHRVAARASAPAAERSRFDGEPQRFHRQVRAAFLALAARNPGRVRVVAADGGPDQVWSRVLAALPEELR